MELYYNIHNSGFSGNIINNIFNNNLSISDFNNNTFYLGGYNNSFLKQFSSNMVYGFYLNKFSGNLSNKTFCPNFVNLDLRSATLIYLATFTYTIFKNGSGIIKISYYDANDQLIITDITA